MHLVVINATSFHVSTVTTHTLSEAVGIVSLNHTIFSRAKLALISRLLSIICLHCVSTI